MSDSINGCNERDFLEQLHGAIDIIYSFICLHGC